LSGLQQLEAARNTNQVAMAGQAGNTATDNNPNSVNAAQAAESRVKDSNSGQG